MPRPSHCWCLHSTHYNRAEQQLAGALYLASKWLLSTQVVYPHCSQHVERKSYMNSMCYASMSIHVCAFVVLEQSTLLLSYLIHLSTIVSFQWHKSCLRLRTWTFYYVGLITSEVPDADNNGVLRVRGNGPVGCGEGGPGRGRQEDCLQNCAR